LIEAKNLNDVISETGVKKGGASIDEEFFIFGLIYMGILRDNQRPMSTAGLVAVMFGYRTGTTMVGSSLVNCGKVRRY